VRTCDLIRQGMFRQSAFVAKLAAMTSVELHPHSPQWTELARAEIARLHEALEGVIVSVHHIGSTSLPGIMAKPIIDLLPVVSDLGNLDSRMPRVKSLGYECLGEFGLPGRRYCRRDDQTTGKRAYQLHFYVDGSPEIDRHLAFAIYLRAHPAIAAEYEAEKLRAAALYPDSTSDYNDAKNDWIKRVEQDALHWWKARR
jgi:GrpB-like predicted nucleotidyltransferase (UPF0157 family)